MAAPSVHQLTRPTLDATHAFVVSPTGWRSALHECYRRKQAVKQTDAVVTLLRLGLFLLAIALYLLI